MSLMLPGLKRGLSRGNMLGLGSPKVAETREGRMQANEEWPEAADDSFGIMDLLADATLSSRSKQSKPWGGSRSPQYSASAPFVLSPDEDASEFQAGFAQKQDDNQSRTPKTSRMSIFTPQTRRLTIFNEPRQSPIDEEADAAAGGGTPLNDL